MRRLAWLGAGFAAGVAFALPRVLNLEGELEACDDADRDSARTADRVERPPPGAEFVEHEGELYSVDPAAVRARLRRSVERNRDILERLEGA